MIVKIISSVIVITVSTVFLVLAFRLIRQLKHLGLADCFSHEDPEGFFCRVLEILGIRNSFEKEFIASSKCVSEARINGYLSEEDFNSLYGLFKQSTIGDFNVKDAEDISEEQLLRWFARFYAFHQKFIINYFRRASWKNCLGMSREDAALKYIKTADELLGKYKDRPGSSTFSAFSRLKVIGENEERYKNDDFFVNIINGNLVTVRKMLKENQKLAEATTPEGLTALHMATDRGHMDIIRLLIKYGSKINATDDSGDTPLHVAIGAQQQSVIDFLLENGADKTIRNIEGNTPEEMLNEVQLLS